MDKQGRRHRKVIVRLTPDEISAKKQLGLIWRAQWRADMAAQRDTASPPAPPRNVSADEAKRRDRFAEGIARAEFGRFYWDDKRAAGKPKAHRTPNGKS